MDCAYDRGAGPAEVAMTDHSQAGGTAQVWVRNADFQRWQSLLTNRNKRQRLGEFLIHGVRPISLAVEFGWPLRRLLCPAGERVSSWARRVIADAGVPTTALAPELLWELGERDSARPELIAVGAVPPDDLGRVTWGRGFLGVVLDRPVSPGNIGALTRSADAFGASGVIVAGHAADVYDPKSVRASTGSLFRLPVVRCPSQQPVLDRVAAENKRGPAVKIVGMDEHGALPVTACDLTVPVLVVIGNETTGMSAAWRACCDETVRIPIGGAASSLNAAAAGTVVLYEAGRQRRFPSGGP